MLRFLGRGSAFSDEHKDFGLIFSVTLTVIMHRTVTTTISKGKNWDFTNFLADLFNFVSFEVFD